MGLEKLHLKHLSKGWQLRPDHQKSGEVFRTKAEAIAAVEKLAERSKDGLIVVVEPRSRPRLRLDSSNRSLAISSAYLVKQTVPRIRYAKRNPPRPETVTLAVMKPAEKAERFRKWAARHPRNTNLPAAAFYRESFYEEHD